MKRIIIFLGLVLFSASFEAFARENIREVFKNNAAIIYTINIRNFAAVDKNGDGIIDVDDGDIKGTFLNAKDKLAQLADDGINTIYLLPITPTGKLKALGTAGSLYALDSFDEINDQLDDTTNKMSVKDEAREFVKKAHELNLNVIVDLPSCGSYDLSLRKPDWFVLRENKEAVVPADWTDVRLFRVYNENNSLNKTMLNNFKSFVDMVQDIGFDGIRADVAAIYPPPFWKEVINYARSKNPNFLFLAEASFEWSNPAPYTVQRYASVQELLNSGFDSFYGPWSDFKNIKSKTEFEKKIIKKNNILRKNKDKTTVATFATHDQQAPILKGKNYWNMVLWLCATMPTNAYFLDGFSVGDDFTFGYENKKAKKSYTDDEYYFVHSGMLDIFNFSGPAQNKHPELKAKYLKAINFKQRHQDLIAKGKMSLIKTDDDKVFAYSVINFDRELIVIGSLDEKNSRNVQVKSKYLNKDYLFTIYSANKHPKIEKDIINASLEPLEIQVYMVSLAKFRAM